MQAELIKQVGKESGVVVTRDDTAVTAGKGRILLVEISDTISSGNAFIGHRKQVKVKGRLPEDRKKLGLSVECARLWTEHLPASSVPAVSSSVVRARSPRTSTSG